jgi:hypothetical protein
MEIAEDFDPSAAANKTRDHQRFPRLSGRVVRPYRIVLARRNMVAMDSERLLI